SFSGTATDSVSATGLGSSSRDDGVRSGGVVANGTSTDRLSLTIEGTDGATDSGSATDAWTAYQAGSYTPSGGWNLSSIAYHEESSDGYNLSRQSAGSFSGTDTAS